MPPTSSTASSCGPLIFAPCGTDASPGWARSARCRSSSRPAPRAGLHRSTRRCWPGSAGRRLCYSGGSAPFRGTGSQGLGQTGKSKKRRGGTLVLDEPPSGSGQSAGPRGLAYIVLLHPPGTEIGRRTTLERDRYLVGREEGADILLDRDSVS